MVKAFKIQKAMWWVFMVCMLTLFVYSLWFMTDFKDLFGLELKINKPVAYFHDVVMQGFNQQLFVASLIGCSAIFLSLCLEIRTKVPDAIALGIMGIILVGLGIFDIVAIIKFPVFEHMYMALDLSHLDMEGATEYIQKSRAFISGIILYCIELIVVLGYFSTLVTSHVYFLKNQRGENCVE